MVSLRPQLPDEAAYGVTDAQIDDFLEASRSPTTPWP